MFEYQYRPNPYAAAIPELLARRGDIAARAAEQRGAATAGMIQTIGNTIAALPGQIQENRRAGQIAEVNDLKLNELRSANRSRNIFEAELRNPANYNDDGSVNDAAITDRLKKQDVGAWQQWQTISAANVKNLLDTKEKIAQINKLTVETDEKQRQIEQGRTDYLGRLSFNALEVLKANPDDPLHARDTALATIARASADRAILPEQSRALSMELARATPAQIRDVLTMAVPPEMRGKLEKESAETAKAKAEADKQTAEAANLRAFGRTTPGTPEEQYLHAITTGDQPTADRILKTIQDTANAKRDPGMQTLAKELGGLRADEARQRLEGLREKNKPIDIAPDVQTTGSGRQYVDLSLYAGDHRDKARTAAGASGVIPVSKEQANALQEIDNARLNQTSILNQISDLLPQSVVGRGAAAVTVPLEKLFQTNEQIAAFNSWRTAAIQTLRATAGSKGLRINQAEIAQAIENDIPRLTDTVATARQKVKNISTMLENAEQSILVRDRHVVPSDVGPSTPPQLTPGLQGLLNR